MPYTVDMVYAVDMVNTVEMLYTVDMWDAGDEGDEGDHYGKGLKHPLESDCRTRLSRSIFKLTVKARYLGVFSN